MADGKTEAAASQRGIEGISRRCGKNVSEWDTWLSNDDDMYRLARLIMHYTRQTTTDGLLYECC